MPEHPYGWLSILPPIVAILAAIATRRVVLSLVAGLFVGALVTRGWNPWLAINDTWETHLWNTLIEPGKLRVFSFTLVMGAMIGVITRSGGMRGLIELVAPLANTRQRGQLATWLLGMLIFFDDYANTILLGSTLRPICDRLKISREKLAYLVDSTAAPVAGLALVSTWVAVEIDYVRTGLENADAASVSAFSIFVATIPYRFYVLGAILFVFLVALLGRDFGPMHRAEQDRLNEPDVEHVPAVQTANSRGPQTSGGSTWHHEPELVSGWYNAVLPIMATLAVVVWLIYSTGRTALGSQADQSLLRDIIGAGDSSLALQYGALIGLLLAGVMATAQRLLSVDEVVASAMNGARIVLPAIAILWTASAVSRMTGDGGIDGISVEGSYPHREYRLYTGDYLKTVLTSQFTGDAQAAPNSGAVRFLPTVVFVLSAFVAFCTGTSWGTMGILLPMVVSLAHSLLTSNGSEDFTTNAIFLSSVGGVLAGSVFGDHCSPISDTTVLSSQSSGCDHIAHVWTQMPYALVVAAVNIFLGTLPVGFGVSVWILLPLQALAILAILLLFGKKVT